MKKKEDNKTIEQTDYDLKAKKKFPPDDIHPVGEQAKQKDNPEKQVVGKTLKEEKKISDVKKKE
ncbi:MAG: hypothetical protein IPM38_11995 [Ignavibacteria bacterium]|nr:hypothetical protein [Ignavibacteria bacterium]